MGYERTEQLKQALYLLRDCGKLAMIGP